MFVQFVPAGLLGHAWVSILLTILVCEDTNQGGVNPRLPPTFSFFSEVPAVNKP